MIFSQIRIANWRQFREVEIDFHPRLTVLTGANGAGKTTILNILSRHFGWNNTFVSTPRRGATGVEFDTDVWDETYLSAYQKWLDFGSTELREPPKLQRAPSEQEIGALTYGDGKVARLTLPASVGASFNVNINGHINQRGMHIPSHRPIYSYQSVESIPTVPRRRDKAFSAYTEIVRARYFGGHHQRTPNYYMKETLIALAAFGYGNEVISRDEESLSAFEGFQSVLRKVLPPSLGFDRISVRLPEVVLVTRSGDFSLDAVSGGIASLVDLAWQVFMYESDDQPFAVTLDEPENHLHPELQRSVLASLLDAFPHVQFICASHNPFVVTSVPDSYTYALRYSADHRVQSEFLSTADRSGTSNEILRDVLGLPSSSPLWVEAAIARIEQEMELEALTPELTKKLRQRLVEEGLERFVPVSLARIISSKSEDDQAEPQ